MVETEALVRWDSLSKTFGPRTLFRELTGAVAPATVVAVVGPNGSGKSTFLRILAGLMRPSSGRVTWNGALGERPKIGFAAPYLQLYSELSAHENLHFFSRLGGEPLGAEAIRERLEEIGLVAADHHKQVSSFSSGMLQRLRIAFALLGAPPVLFLDEPGSNLDEAGRKVVRRVVREQAGRGSAILATNDPEEAALADIQISLG